ncbi:MAG: Crp/Fnr family transcriptional regulator [Chitinophagaceae bacterium]|nr:Crp/Fnr family transcriptional regulator [Chitinophagaceae bacterium]MCW5926162.1 Crp/Fnr family transcriptional regulator [Chitinophagaceae bacterium]
MPSLKSYPLDTRKQQHFFSALDHFYPLESDVKTWLGKKLRRIKVGKGELLLHAGNICRYIYFIEKGALRGFIREGTKNITTWISVENEMVTSIYSLDMEVPALENIEAIENCSLFVLKSTDVKQLYVKYPSFNTVGRKILQQYYRDAERRAFLVRHTNATLKYKLFLEHYSHLSNRVPLKLIASFLGMALETLSRVRKKMTRSK